MGCGSSSLKGDAPGNVGGAEPNIKKVPTNFAEVDYAANSKGRRDTTFAPHESQKPASTINEGSKRNSAEAVPGGEVAGASAIPQGDKLAPYKSVGGTDDPLSPGNDTAREHALAPNQVSTNQMPFKGAIPSNQAVDSSSDITEFSKGEQKKKGWYQRYSDHKIGRNNPISDEDLKKYTGMDRNQLDNYVANPNNQLAQHQNPLRVTGTAAGGFGATSLGDGVGGWGPGDGGRRFPSSS